MKTNKTEKRVYYHDTDHGGVVYYANYLKWFEIGRTELLRQSGFDYAGLEKIGIIAPVVEVKCTYKEPIKYNDSIMINTAIGKIGNTSIRFNYQITNKDNDKLVAEGHTVNVFVDIKTKNPIRIPDDLRMSLKAR